MGVAFGLVHLGRCRRLRSIDFRHLIYKTFVGLAGENGRLLNAKKRKGKGEKGKSKEKEYAGVNGDFARKNIDNCRKEGQQQHHGEPDRDHAQPTQADSI